MSRGTAQVNYAQEGGECYRAGITSGGSWDFIYTVSATKDTRYNVGDRVILPDGRVFRYAKAGAACYAGQIAVFYGAAAVTYTTVAAAQDIGDRSVTIASQTFTLDQLRGGQVVMGHQASTNCQQRGIIGNTAASSATVTIYLDAPLIKALTTSDGIEVLPNPYMDLRTLNGNEEGYCSAAGVAAGYADAANEYFWVQTWGPAYITCAETGVGGVSSERQLVVNAGGGCRPHSAAYATTKQYQHLGFIADRNSSGTDSAPWVFLQINP